MYYGEVCCAGGYLTFHEGDSRVTETLAPGFCRGNGGELGRVGPAADGEERLHLPVLLLEEVQLFDAAISVFPLVVPRVCGVVLLKV
jgi:hypothetical protein